MEYYISNKNQLYNTILEFLENSDEGYNEETSENCFHILSTLLKIEENGISSEEMQQFLEIIKNISDHHHRDAEFIKRIKQILQHYKSQIKQTLSNDKIFHIFEDNKLILLFLFQNDIITISEAICEEMLTKFEPNGNRFCHFFYPEIEKVLSEEKSKEIKDELLSRYPDLFDNYEEKRQVGENDSYLCSLIRKDSVVEFISYMNFHNISYSSQITPSIFETNSFLIENKNTTLIEYSAFFGSIQIFQHLLLSKVELTPSLWLYSIHSKNPELFNLIESNQILPPESTIDELNYTECLIESIKCHHNDFFEYINNNLMIRNEKEKIISACIQYHNFALFQIDAIIEYGFFYLHFYDYKELFDLLYQKKESEIENRANSSTITKAANENDVEVIYFLLSKFKLIKPDFFMDNKKIKQIIIPPSVTLIGSGFFHQCSSLKQVSISSVTTIENKAFYECSSLTDIAIHSSLESIGKNAFIYCRSLKKITFPSSVIQIGPSAFYKCFSLEQVSIPSSVTSISFANFYECKSLIYFAIPSSVTSIGSNAFNECESLRKILIPSSINSIGVNVFVGCLALESIVIYTCPEKRIKLYEDQLLLLKSDPSSDLYDEFILCKPTIKEVIIPSFIKTLHVASFYECSLLTQISLPSSITSISDHAFYKCSSLAQITIPSSVTSIGDFSFYGCSLLAQITIPSSVTSIGSNAFNECSSLTLFEFPSSITTIKENTLNDCSSLVQVIIPSSVDTIEHYAFMGCSSLTQVSFVSPSHVISIGHDAFNNCLSLKQISIPSSVTSIGDFAFIRCFALREITIPSSINRDHLYIPKEARINTIERVKRKKNRK